MSISGIVIFVLVLMLLIKIKCYKDIMDKPGCYGHYRAGDSRALCGCEDCELEYECERTAKERWRQI